MIYLTLDCTVAHYLPSYLFLRQPFCSHRNSRKKYHMMRFHNANQVDFKQWTTAKMERENNYKEFKSLDDDQPK